MDLVNQAHYSCYPTPGLSAASCFCSSNFAPGYKTQLLKQRNILSLMYQRDELTAGAVLK